MNASFINNFDSMHAICLCAISLERTYLHTLHDGIMHDVNFISVWLIQKYFLRKK